jgi:hypothetical protein
MWGIASLINGLFDILLAPFRGMHPAVGLVVVSIATGVIMLMIFGKVSNQDAIRRAKGRLKAHIAEIWLFRNDLLQMLLAVVRVLAHTGRYFLHSLRPLIVLIIPVLIIMVMLGLRYELRPLKVGETAIFKVQLEDPAWTRGDAVQLHGTGAIAIESPPLRIPQLAEIDWKIRAAATGVHEIVLSTPGGEVTKRIHISDDPVELRPGRSKIAAQRGRAFSGAFLLFPAEAPLPSTSGVRRIAITDWPRHKLRIFGVGVHWLIVFFVISIAAGFAVKDIFGVEV